MKKSLRLMSVIFVLFLAGLVKAEAVRAAEVLYDIPITAIHPTQGGIGKLQIAYKVTTYLDNGSLTKDFYKDFNDDNGYTSGNYVNAKGNPKQDKDLYKADSIRVVKEGAMVVADPAVEVVKGPSGQLYAIDGHHGANTYQMINDKYELGFSVINVTVVDDYANLSEADFWQKMAENNYYFPKVYSYETKRYEKISPDNLPATMQMDLFVNDPFRSLNYYLRKTVIDKDRISVPFAEFYWGEFLTATGQFDDLDLSQAADYSTALARANVILKSLIEGDEELTQLFADKITSVYHVSAAQLGLQANYDETDLAKQQTKLETAIDFSNGDTTFWSSAKIPTSSENKPTEEEPKPVVPEEKPKPEEKPTEEEKNTNTNNNNSTNETTNSGNGLVTPVVPTTPVIEVKPVVLYRAYNPNSGEHLYTVSQTEYAALVAQGWQAEEKGWNTASKGTQVYRLYNPNSGEHFYTTDEKEYETVANAGWQKEGLAFYSDDNHAVAVYRLFNPNAQNAGSHHFTIDEAECTALVAAGWKAEGIAFYGVL